MPNTRPDTEFVDGLCSACIAFDKRQEVDWDERENDLRRILERSTGEYTCIVPSSGGKDSHYQVLTLKEMGARPLVVTAETCHLTDIGRRNIDNLARHADTHIFSPNKTVRRKLNRISLEILGDISWPEHVLIHTYPFKVAIEKKIPLVFYGENPLNQYGGPTSDRQTELRMNRRWVSEFGGFLGMRPMDFIGMDDITASDMDSYCGPTDKELDNAGIEVYFLGQFIPWDSHRNSRVAVTGGMEERLPCSANWWPFENLDNAQTGLHDYFMYLKYGFGRARAQLSVDIRNGAISREEALKVAKAREHIFPEQYADVWCVDMLNAIGMTRENLDQCITDFNTLDLR
jgi:N-acetyl sugar amidotransferase